MTPEGGTVSYTWRLNDKVETMTDARGKTTTWFYNTRDLVTGAAYNDGGVTPAVNYTYDEFGARASMTDGEGTTAYVYNAARQLASETRTISGLGGRSYTFGYTYNLLGGVKRVSQSTAGWSRNVNYAYKATGALAGVGTDLVGSDPNATTNILHTTSYRAFGMIKELHYGNGRRLRLAYYGARQQLASLIVDRTDGTDPIANYSYEYGIYDSELDLWRNNGRIKRIVDNVDPAFTADYSYDSYDRLTGIVAGAYTRGYSYDPWGNLRQVWGTGGESPSYTLN